MILAIGAGALIGAAALEVSAQNGPPAPAPEGMAAGGMGGGGYTGPITLCPGAITDTRPHTAVFKTEFTTLKGQVPNGAFGESVAGGDIDGDGYTDIAVGATNEEKVYVYRGSNDGIATTPTAVLKGEQDKGEFGRSLAVGDVNGDGYADVIVGAHSFDAGLGPHQGKFYVFLGGPKGVSDKPSQSIVGEHKGDEFGRTFAVYDMDGDGINDVLTGASGYNGDQIYQGKAYVYRGTKNGLVTKPWFAAVGEHGDDEFGRAVTAADLNHDGHMDLIVGQPGLTGGPRAASVSLTVPGTMYVFYGSARGLSPTADFKAPGEMIKGHLGEGLSAAGDVNHDGYDDVAIGARDFSCGQGAVGKIYLYLGGAKGLSKDRVWTLTGKGSGIGRTMAPAGDLDGDGYADFISSAPLGTPERGAGVYIFFGGATTWGKAPVAITTEVNSGIGFGISAAGDINKDGAPDIVIGAPTGGDNRQGWVRVYYGKIASRSKQAARK